MQLRLWPLWIARDPLVSVEVFLHSICDASDGMPAPQRPQLISATGRSYDPRIRSPMLYPAEVLLLAGAALYGPVVLARELSPIQIPRGSKGDRECPAARQLL